MPGVAGDAYLPVDIVVDGNGLQFVDAFVQLGHGVCIVVLPQDDIAVDVELVLLFRGQLMRWIRNDRRHALHLSEREGR